MMPTISEQERRAVEALEARGCMTSLPGEGHPSNPLAKMWGVFVGSHGGHGKTLPKAMRACLQCCGLGAWWRCDFGEGELLRDLFASIERDQLRTAPIGHGHSNQQKDF